MVVSPAKSLRRLLEPYSPPTHTMVERLQFWAREIPDQLAFAFLADGENDDARLTFAELDLAARRVAAELLTRGYHRQRALLLYPPGLEFVAAYFGCLYAGVIAIPGYPPRRNRNMHRIDAIANDAGAVAALSTQDTVDRTVKLLSTQSKLGRIDWLATDTSTAVAIDSLPPRVVDDVAMLQYTSGSTGEPKGVMLTHGNLTHNCSLITGAFQAGRDVIGGSWLPTYHDMGLVGGVLNPVFCGRPSYLMSPMLFLQRPSRWLKAISRYRISISGGPNFAYDLCARKITDEEARSLDLSCWSLAFNGAEPVRKETLDRFAARFGPYGFRSEAFYPCYGMAETTLIVTGGETHRSPVIRCFDGSALDENRVELAAPDGDQGRYAVGCGKVLPDENVLIVNPDTLTRQPNGRVGEIWINSPSVAKGYWNQPEITETTFHARLANEGSHGEVYLRSGDLGFFQDGELFVTGRLKDLIIVRGVNRYPQDIEMTVERADKRLRSGAAAAFAVDLHGRERLIVVSEVERSQDDDWDQVIDAIRRDVTMQHELPPDGVILVRAGSIPKTSSGKIQRHACRESFLDNSLKIVAERLMWQAEDLELASPEAADQQPLTQLQSNGTSVTEKRASTVNARGDRSTVVESDDLDGDRQERPDVIAVVKQYVRQIARERATHLDAQTNIVELGLDSLERLEIINMLEGHYGGQFPEEVLPEIETVTQVADAVLAHILTQQNTRPENQVPEEFYRFDQMTEYQQLQRNKQLLISTGLPNPYFNPHEGVTRDTAMIGGRELISFATYNYLGMSGDPAVSQAAKDAVDQFGTSVSASRLVSGEKTLHGELECELAGLVGVDSALVFVGGHSTNETTIGHLLGPGDLILHDALAHNSIIQGAKLSGARRRPFPHNDWEALDQLLAELRHDYRRVMVVVEGVYSMDGDYPNLPRFVEVKKRHKVLLMVDEAHSIGTMGSHGRGIGEHFGINPRDVDVWMGTLSKSFGSCGGYIAGDMALIEYLKYTAPGFVYSVGLSPPNAGAALAAMHRLHEEPWRAAQCRERAAQFIARANRYGLNTGSSQGTPVVPIIVGSSVIALKLARRMFERGINVQPILYPAVEESAARLRFFICSTHTVEQINRAVDTVAEELSLLLHKNSGSGTQNKPETNTQPAVGSAS